MNGCSKATKFVKENKVLTGVLIAGAGVVTYLYLKKQLKEMKKIENVDARQCEASEEGRKKKREAYCVEMGENAIRFAKNSDKINEQSLPTLRKVAKVLKKSDKTLIYIEGHTDSDGSKKYNQSLSNKRAISVQNFFTQQGIKSDRIQALGYGESRLKVDENGDSNNKALNRRVELRVEGGKA